MATLTVTARGQVTFRKEVLNHLGIRPGSKIRLELLPDGRAELKAEQLAGSWHDLKGILAGKTNGVRLSIEEMEEAIAEAGAAAGLSQPLRSSPIRMCSSAPSYPTMTASRRRRSRPWKLQMSWR